MTIFGIEGGIGTGKTLTLATMLLDDLRKGKKIISNIKFKHLTKEEQSRYTFIEAEFIDNIFEKVKNNEIDLRNTTIGIQEAHNYADSRNSASKRNKIFSYWILQSRHTGEGSCDIVYDTQELGQVDKRLRRNTDFVVHPIIVQWNQKGKVKIPSVIRCEVYGKIGHEYQETGFALDVTETCKMYDTHQIVEFKV